MNEFDLKASEWDFNPMHIARSEAVVKHILKENTFSLLDDSPGIWGGNRDHRFSA